MSTFEKLLASIRNNPKGVKFRDASRVAEHYFGTPRVKGSHNVYTMPWAGFPRVNLQDTGGYVDSYQVLQLLAAIDRVESEEKVKGDGEQA